MICSNGCAVLPGLFCYQIIVLVQFDQVFIVQNSIFQAHFVVVFSADFVCISWYRVEVGNLHCLKLPTNVMFLGSYCMIKQSFA